MEEENYLFLAISQTDETCSCNGSYFSISTDEETRKSGRALSSPITEGQQSNDKTFHFVFIHFTDGSRS